MGFVFGGATGILKFGGSSSAGVAPFLYAGASGLQTFAIGTTFWTIRTATIAAWTTTNSTPTTGDLVKASAVSGGITGGVLAAILRGRSNVVPGVIMFTIFGSAGQWMYNSFADSRNADAGPKTNFWERVGERKWSPMKVLSNEEYATMLKERQLKIDAEVAVIDDKITALRGQIEDEPRRQRVEGKEET